jgi:outer membrane protein OmpA-like peptidoglycan-associated protein
MKNSKIIMKRILIIVLIGFCSVAAFAQAVQNRHEFSIWGAGGLSTLQFKPVTGKNTLGLESAGGFAGLGYNYAFHYNWSIGIGAEYSILNSETKLPLLEDNYKTPSTSSEYIYHIFVEGVDYKQTHTAGYVNVPLSIKFQTNEFGNGKRWYIAAAAKAGIPVDGKYKTAGNMITKGWEITPGETDYFSKDAYVNMPHHGFGRYAINESKRKINFENNLIVSLETGMKWRLSSNEKWFLYTGLFVDYGVANVIKNVAGSEIYEFNRFEPANYTANSILNSSYNDGSQMFTGKVNTLTAGIKVQLAFGIKPFERKYKDLPQEKDFEGLTEDQARKIINDNTNRLIEAIPEPKEAPLPQEDSFFSATIVGFDLDKAIILPYMYPILDRAIEFAKKDQTSHLLLTGHTDDLGSKEHNVDLGMKRAVAIKEYLVARGVSSSRLDVASEGDRKPIFANADEGKRRLNRRVEISVQ